MHSTYTKTAKAPRAYLTKKPPPNLASEPADPPGLQAEGLDPDLEKAPHTILEVAKDTVEAERQTDPEEEQDQAVAALTELFNEAKSKNTHVIVERIVAEIDSIVRQVRFDGWQNTSVGEREVQKALRSALRRYQLHTDQELFDKAYGYIREYY